MPKKAGKKKAKKKTSKSADDPESFVQLGTIPNKTMVQQMASETLSVAGSSRSGISSRERVSATLVDTFAVIPLICADSRVLREISSLEAT